MTKEKIISNTNQKNISELIKDKWISKIWIQIIFIIILTAMFFVDKILWLTKPPLADIWYLLSFLSIHWVDPYQYIKNIKITKWQS